MKSAKIRTRTTQMGISIFLVLVLTLSMTLSVTAETVWEEDFELESSDQWEMMSYHAEPSIESGVLESYNELLSINSNCQYPGIF